jgi:hypothetical protein
MRAEKRLASSSLKGAPSLGDPGSRYFNERRRH